MAKQQQNNKLARNQRGEIVVEQKVVADDNLLPSADELERLHALNPDIVTWIMGRAEQEQQARIEFNKKRTELWDKDLKGGLRFNMTALILGFILAVIFILIAIVCILKGLPTQGTIFGSVTIVVTVSLFVRAAAMGRKKSH